MLFEYIRSCGQARFPDTPEPPRDRIPSSATPSRRRTKLPWRSSHSCRSCRPARGTANDKILNVIRVPGSRQMAQAGLWTYRAGSITKRPIRDGR